MGVIVLEEVVEVVGMVVRLSLTLLIFTMLGGEVFVTVSTLIVMRTSALLFLLFFLDFLNTSSSF